MYTQKGQMPPKKKEAVKAAKATSKKAPAKRPVGRPRKPLGTRVSDVDLLANVGSTKPMPRRIGRDALEQQRARLRFARDYPGQRFTEQMTRALQDSFSTGMLPYGVSLRAPEPFARKYKTSFAPIAGMPVWPAYNPGSAPPGTGRAARRSTASGPGPGPGSPLRPSKRMLLERLEELLDEEDEGTERSRMRMAAVPNARQVSRRSATAIKKELDALARTGKTAATREALLPSLGSTTSSSSSTSSAPGRISEDKLKKLEAAMSRLVTKAAEAEAAPQRPQPRTSIVISEMQRKRLGQLQARVAAANSTLASPMTSSQAAEYDDLRAQLRADQAEIRDIMEYSTLTYPTAPPAQQMVVSVPDPVAVNTELQELDERAAVLRQQLSLKRAGKSLASAKRELESILQRQQEIRRETASATPSSAPVQPQPTVPQSIPVPGTEAPDSQQETIMSQYAIEIGRLNQKILDLQRQLGNDEAQKDQVVRGMRATEEELSKQIQKLKAEKSALNVKLLVATAPSEKDLRKEIKGQVSAGVSPEELAAIESFVMATVKSRKGLKPGTVDAYMKSGKKIDIEARSQQFQRQLDALNIAKQQIADPNTTPSDLRYTAGLGDTGDSMRERLLDEADRRDPNALILREPRAPRVPVYTDDQLRMVSQEVETDRAPANTVVIPPAENLPEPQSELAIPNPTVNGNGLQHVTAATFPSGKWTTASSLRWLRSNGLHPIRKSTKINGAYSYALQSPAGYSSFNSVKMSHKNKDFTIVYGTPK